MHSTTIFLLAVGLLATVAMARPGKRPSSGNHHGHGGNGKPEGNGNKWSVVRVPQYVRLPLQLAGQLEQPRATFTAKKILDGKYLVISPALIFKLKDNNAETTTTSPVTEDPEIEDTTTDEPSAEETTTPTIDEDSTTPESEEEESTIPTPSFFRKRSFEIDEDEQLLFLDD